jgi:exopolyphosphatase/guanosine-5'-triphosphate,3'-diphosphate pyrophosphatase
MKGFSRDEAELIALVARYHRKAPPSPRHQAFRRLDPWKKPVVEKLAALLRVADALDRTHRGRVADLRVEVRRKKVILRAATRGAADLELWAAGEKGDLFERVFGRRLVVRPAKRAMATKPARAKSRPLLRAVPALAAAS